MMLWDGEMFRDLLAVLGDGLNPYQPMIDNLEIALDYCQRGAHGTSDVPQAAGGTEISSPTFAAASLIEEALEAAKQWRDAFDYHVKGGHGGHRSDF